MVKIVSLRGNVFLDTAPLIYFIEGHSIYQQVLSQIFDRNDKGHFNFITSTITLLEVLVKPLRIGSNNLALQYQDFLTNGSGIEIFDITTEISIKAAELRAKFRLQTPDAIQMATAIINKADYFLTNDFRLASIREIDSLILSELE